MAAREDQAQPFVGNRLVLLVDLDGLERGQQLGLAPECLLAADPVDRAVASGRQQPGAGVGGSALAGPALERCGERFLDRVLGELDVTERAGQDREGPPPLFPEELFYYESSPSKTITGRTSTEPWRDAGIFAAHSIASSSEPASIR